MIIPIFMEHPATNGSGLAVEIAGVAAGILGGLAVRASRLPSAAHAPAVHAGR